MTSIAPAPRLRWATQLADAARASAVAWAPTLPALPDAVADMIARVHGIRLTSAADARDPWAVGSFAALFAQTRADQALRALSARTNLVLSGTTTRVLGDGPLADALTVALTRIGSRVIRSSDDPRTRLRAALAGLSTDPDTAVHQTIATGEDHPPLDPLVESGLLLDASTTGTAVSAARGSAARPGVTRVAEDRAWVVEIPPPFSGDPDPSQVRMLDALVTLSLLSDAEDLDRAFAEAVLS